MDVDVAATNAYVTKQKRLADRASFYLADQWDQLDSRDGPDVDHLADNAGPTLKAFQIQSIALSASYLSIVTEESLETTDPVTEIPWRDPFIAYWRKLKTTGDYLEALKSGRNRAARIGHDVVFRASDDYVRGVD